MKIRYATFFTIAFIFINGLVYAKDVKNEDKLAMIKHKQWETVSIIQLIATPEEYNGKVVLVIGYVKLEFEGDAVYLSENDYKNGITKNALWINIGDGIRKNKEKYNMKYCLITGVFNSKRQGHMNLFSGEIDDIDRFEVWVSGQRK